MGINFGGGGGSTKIQVTEEGTESDVSTTLTPIFRGSIEAGSWSQKGPVPTNQTYKNAASAALGDYFYILHGAGSLYDTTTELWRLDPSNGSYTLLTDSQPKQYYRPAGLVSDGSNALYVVGGYDRDNSSTHPEIFKYDVGSNSWSQQTTVPNPRRELAVSYHDGKIYLAAGYNGNNDVSRFSWYDVQTDVWTQGPDYPLQTSSIDGDIGGGYFTTVGAGSNGDRTFLYDFDGSQWLEATSSKYNFDAPSAAYHKGKLYVSGNRTVNAATYDTNTDSWSDLPDFNGEKEAGGAGVVNGEILFSPYTNTNNSVEGYKPPDPLFTAGTTTRIVNETTGSLRNKTTGNIGQSIFVRKGDVVVPGGGGEYDIYAQT